MIKTRTFSETHYWNFFGLQTLRTLKELQQKAAAFMDRELGESQLISITETRDFYATTVTVWYKKNNNQ